MAFSFYFVCPKFWGFLLGTFISNHNGFLFQILLSLISVRWRKQAVSGNFELPNDRYVEANFSHLKKNNHLISPAI
jgi:hypothetical protein